MEGYYSREELKELGLKSFGENVLISKKTSIYMPEMISIGHDVRIDDFCFLVGDITIGNYIHIAPYASIHGTGGGKVIMKDYTGLGSYSTVYAASDNFAGKNLVNPMAGSEFEELLIGTVVMENFSSTGIRCTMMEKSHLGEGTLLGACSFLNGDTKPWSIYFGVPCRKIKDRDPGIVEIVDAAKKKNGSKT